MQNIFRRTGCPIAALAPADRARTVLASWGTATISPVRGAGSACGSGEGTDVVLAALTHEGSAYVAVRPGLTQPRGMVRLALRSHLSELGRLVVTGFCGDPRPAVTVPAIVGHLMKAAPGLRGSGLVDSVWSLMRLPVVPVQLASVDLAAPTGSPRIYRSWSVPVAEFLDATADPWICGQRELIAGVEGYLRTRVAALPVGGSRRRDVESLAVRGVGPGGISVLWLGPDGVREEFLAFEPLVTDPSDVALRLLVVGDRFADRAGE